MPYTFGAGTGDDITVTAGVGGVSSNAGILVMGWWFPTTLTATRGYWSCGNVVGCAVDTTTSELRITLDATTDPVYTTSGAGITVDSWWFIASLFTATGTGPASTGRVWVGNNLNAPAEVTVTQAVAPTGTLTGSASRTVGNIGTGVLSFQGDIASVSFIATNNIGNSAGLFNLTANGAIAQSEADNVLQKWVIPYWMGRPQLSSPGVLTAGYDFVHFPLDKSDVVTQVGDDGNLAPYLAMTINGATYTDNYPTRQAPLSNWIRQSPRRRR